MSKYKNIILKFSKKSILVIGDVILDRHIQGSVFRISPEAPVPIVLEDKSFFSPGGAANVARNLGALGAKVTQVGRIGNDFEGKILKRELKKQGIDIQGILVDASIPTVTKTRVIAQHQQVVRIDREKPAHLGDKAVNRKIVKFIEKNIQKFDGVIISDYGKGIVTPQLVETARDLAIEKKIPITVDPKVEHFRSYSKVTAITPNKKEAENAIRNIKITESSKNRLKINIDRLDTLKEIDRAGEQLLKYLDLESLLITLGEQGMQLFQKGKKPVHIHTKAQDVFDVTGAGDTVISVFTLGLAVGATKLQAADLANYAAGIVVGKMGAVSITREELLAATCKQ